MAFSFYNFILLFYERDANNKGRQQDPGKLIETLTFIIDRQAYTNKIRKQSVIQVIFCTHL